MSAENSLSLKYYKYLCQQIGTEEEVKIRILTYLVEDLGFKISSDSQITSGSLGEGLQLKGSDQDVMFIDPFFKVYESDRNFVSQSGRCIPLIMDTDDTHPCFTQLHLPNNYDLNVDHLNNKIMKILFMDRKASSDLYRLYRMERLSIFFGISSIIKFHGPCISILTETLDFACCFKSDQWIAQAQPWIIRSRTTWPSPELISKIVSRGVLYVPIGYKGSINECLQWRISFSVAEKFLIFSFSHIQLLCYAMFKVLVKEIVEKHEDLKSVLCSYFLKTLMFWISEESDPSMWTTDKIIPCFMACLKRLIYCVEYSTLLHYFIPDNNLFYLRFDDYKKVKMTSIMKNLFGKGIYCFVSSETLRDFMTPPFNSMELSINRHVASLHDIMSTVFTHNGRPLNLLYHYLHHSSSKLSKRVFFEMLSFAHQNVPQISQDQPRSNNKHKYYKYKRDLSHLLIGTNSDAVAGWLVLSSFFYVHDKYLLSLDIINYALGECTNKKMYPLQIGLNQNEKYILQFLKRTELCTILKTITIKYPNFHQHLPIMPQELQLNGIEQLLVFIL